jgi:hypothetical protein
VSDLGQKFQHVSFYHSKEGQVIKTNMAQQQDLDLSCELSFDHTFVSSPPVSFYQLLEEETVPLEGNIVQHQGAADESYVFSGNLQGQSVRDPSNLQLGMKHPTSVTVPPNQHDISSDSYVLPGSLMGPSGHYVPEHLPELPETEHILLDPSSDFTPQHNSSETAPLKRICQTGSAVIRKASHLIPGEGYGPVANVYSRPENNDPIVPSQVTSDSCSKVLFAGLGDGYVPDENILPQTDSEGCDVHSSVSAVRSQDSFPSENNSVEGDTRLQAEGSKHPVATVSSGSRANLSSKDSFVPSVFVHKQPLTDDLCGYQIPRKLSSSDPEDCSGGVPAKNLQGKDNPKCDGANKSKHRPPNGMVNGYISLPQEDGNEYVPPFK